MTNSAADRAAASSPNTPLERLASLAHENPELRSAIAANPSAYPDLLTWLAGLGDPDVDNALAFRTDAKPVTEATIVVPKTFPNKPSSPTASADADRTATQPITGAIEAPRSSRPVWFVPAIAVGSVVVLVLAVLAGVGIASGLSHPTAAASEQSSTPESGDDTASPAPSQKYFTELPPSSFTAVSPASLADPGFYLGTPMSGVHFVSPSTNLGCAITGAQDGLLWGCYAAATYWKWPTNTGGPCGDPDAVDSCSTGIEAEGEGMPAPRQRGDAGYPGAMAAPSGNKAPYTLGVLQYGQKVTFGNVTCYSESRGVTCVNDVSEHGFVIAKDLNTIF